MFAVLVGLYLADCLILLGPGQAVMSFERRNLRLDFGLTAYVLRGKVPALLNPFTPWAAVFRTRPLFAPPAVAQAVRLHPLRRCSGWTMTAWPMLAFQSVILFAAVPYFTMTARYPGLVVAVGASFIAAGFLLFFGWRASRGLGLSRRQYWSLGFQALVCPPLSLNVPRKLALLASVEYTALDLLPRISAEQRDTICAELRFAIEAQSAGSSDQAEIARLEALQKAIDGGMV